MSVFNQPEEPLVRYVNVKLPPGVYARFDSKREELGITWSQFFRSAGERMYFG